MQGVDCVTLTAKQKQTLKALGIKAPQKIIQIDVKSQTHARKNRRPGKGHCHAFFPGFCVPRAVELELKDVPVLNKYIQTILCYIQDKELLLYFWAATQRQNSTIRR